VLDEGVRIEHSPVVSSIWATDETGWHLLAPSGFQNEQALHSLVEQTPELLPLAGTPELIVLGSEVPLGGGFADLLAVEPSGRLVLLEVKLASNAEARRAVVAQILAYAAFLKGTASEVLEQQILRTHLRERGFDSIAAAVSSQDQQGSFDTDAFAAGLADSLAAGRFRLVLVLDDAPTELIRLVGYLESVAPELVIDLVTLSAYDVNGSQVLVPQRLDAERPDRAPASKPPSPTKQGYLISPEEFETSIAEAREDQQAPLRRMYTWARNLEAEGLIRLLAYRGSTGRTTLLPYVPSDEAGLITVWNDGNFYISLWRSVLERHAPESIARIEQLIAPTPLGRGNTVKNVSDDLLTALTEAYREAAA
jgi:hypothetical protein